MKKINKIKHSEHDFLSEPPQLWKLFYKWAGDQSVIWVTNIKEICFLRITIADSGCADGPHAKSYSGSRQSAASFRLAPGNNEFQLKSFRKTRAKLLQSNFWTRDLITASLQKSIAVQNANYSRNLITDSIFRSKFPQLFIQHARFNRLGTPINLHLQIIYGTEKWTTTLGSFNEREIYGIFQVE